MAERQVAGEGAPVRLGNSRPPMCSFHSKWRSGTRMLPTVALRSGMSDEAPMTASTGLIRSVSWSSRAIHGAFAARHYRPDLTSLHIRPAQSALRHPRSAFALALMPLCVPPGSRASRAALRLGRHQIPKLPGLAPDAGPSGVNASVWGSKNRDFSELRTVMLACKLLLEIGRPHNGENGVVKQGQGLGQRGRRDSDPRSVCDHVSRSMRFP